MPHELIAGNYAVDNPSQFFGYTFQKVIGSGSFSLVVLATEDCSGKPFAVKILSRQFLIEHEVVQQFERELTILSSIEHPNVVSFSGLYNDEELIYIVMEYCPGGSLQSLIVREGGIPENQARPIVQQLFAAVQYVHSRGIAHRDLKLDNILIGSNSAFKLADFGFSDAMWFAGLRRS
jgi:serine/threonine protein kinase